VNSNLYNCESWEQKTHKMAQAHLLPTVVDALFAAASAIIGIALLLWLESAMAVKLFDSKYACAHL
jgi:hypothetical protein